MLSFISHNVVLIIAHLSYYNKNNRNICNVTLLVINASSNNQQGKARGKALSVSFNASIIAFRAIHYRVTSYY